MTENSQDITTRSPRLFYIFLVVIFAVFTWRLFDLQVLSHGQYNDLALAEHLRKFEIPAQRGDIYLTDGNNKTPVVLNEVRPTLFADPSGVEDPAEAARILSEITGDDRAEYEELLAQEDSVYAVLAKKLTKEQADKVTEAELFGIGLQDVPYRVYPEKSLAAQTIGFVNDEGIGQYGVEAALQDDLGGQSGLLRAITDVNGIPLTGSDETIEQPAIEGQDITLTIDRTTQAAVEKLLAEGVERAEAESGSAVVVNPNTGEVIAMANFPTYDPSDFGNVEDFGVFSNDIVSAAYETGSGVKVFTMAAGLNEGVINKDSTYFDAGFVQVEDRRIENAGNSGGFTRSMLEVIQKSVNTGVVYVLQQLGGGFIGEQARVTLHDYFTNNFGFGSVTGIEQTNEAAGTIIGPNEQEGNSVRYANMAFGQGMTVTMIQMVAAFSAVVNGGDYYQPRLVSEIGDTKIAPEIKHADVISDEVSEALLEMTQAVVTGGGGYTAQRDGYFIGGKTGTAQVLQEDGTYSDSREIGSFIGYTGGDKAEYVIMTRVDEPGIPGYAGSIAAAPIFADISNWLIDHNQIAPGGE